MKSESSAALAKQGANSAQFAKGTAHRRWVYALAFAVVLVLVPMVVATQSAQAQTFTSLYSFTGKSDGGVPWASLVRDNAGNLYGTTTSGGDLSCRFDSSTGCGTVFKLSPAGKEATLHIFKGLPDGSIPHSSLILDSAGNLYGTTSGGGASDNGTVFKVNTKGKETLLHSFTGGTDGATPDGSVIMDAAGNLFGTTFNGTVFKLDTRKTLTVLYTFIGFIDGHDPYSGLVEDKNGNLYGTTETGGDLSCFVGEGCGTVFKLDASGVETVLHSFVGGADAEYPVVSLIEDKKGNFYGTTEYGGDPGCSVFNDGCGTVFKVDSQGNETVLYRFKGGTDGEYPVSGLVQDKKGNL
jgi:uncharacterized repeat protein (TIGR03803 family)